MERVSSQRRVFESEKGFLVREELSSQRRASGYPAKEELFRRILHVRRTFQGFISAEIFQKDFHPYKSFRRFFIYNGALEGLSCVEMLMAVSYLVKIVGGSTNQR